MRNRGGNREGMNECSIKLVSTTEDRKERRFIWNSILLKI